MVSMSRKLLSACLDVFLFSMCLCIIVAVANTSVVVTTCQALYTEKSRYYYYLHFTNEEIEAKKLI